jgi:hypothetical protein
MHINRAVARWRHNRVDGNPQSFLIATAIDPALPPLHPPWRQGAPYRMNIE